MNNIMTPEIREVMDAVQCRPAISIIMPFNPKMGLKRTLTSSLDKIADKLEHDLMETYPGGMGILVIQKLRAIIRGLNYDTHKSSIAIYVSPLFEKVLYLDCAVEQKIIVDDSFAIRDLVYNKKKMQKYLLLVLSGQECRIYFGNSNDLTRIVSTTHESVTAYKNDAPERVANFSDNVDRMEILRNKFLQHIDNSLDILLKAYPYPIFVLAPEKIIGHFKKLTRHSDKVVEYVHGNFEEANSYQLKGAIEPLIEDWEKVRQMDILNQLEEAAGKKKLAIGMRDVWREAMKCKGRLLVVEKNYKGSLQRGGSEEIIYQAMNPYYTFSYIQDMVDEVIEKLLENGGDVEFVEEGFLDAYHQIALIQYY